MREGQRFLIGAYCKFFFLRHVLGFIGVNFVRIALYLVCWTDSPSNEGNRNRLPSSSCLHNSQKIKKKPFSEKQFTRFLFSKQKL